MSDTRRRLLEAGGTLALIRLAAVPVFFAAERLVDHPVENTDPFDELLLGAGLSALVAFAAELHGRPIAPARRLAGLDLLVIFALVTTSGGPFSQLRYAFFAVPVGAALLLRPAFTALVTIVCLALYAVVALTFPDPEGVRSDATGFEVTHGSPIP